MKKIIAFLAVLCTIGVGVSALAADINFTSEGNGKWIYCNNPEGIRNCDLMNSDENPPSYIMNNENLTPDLYDFLICHMNATDTDDGYGKGYNIELDVELTAVENSEITINKAFFETPLDDAYIYSDGTWAKVMNKVGCLNGLASFLGVNLAEMNGACLYEAQKYESVTIELEKGETIWLSSYMDGYRAVNWGKPVQIMGEIELTSGKLNFNVAAFKSGEEVGDRSGFDPEAKFGEYTYDRMQKGIADSLPKVSVDLEYKIDYSYRDGDLVKNKVYNQYAKNGKVTDVWCTQLNPQDDLWSKTISAESDLLYFKYTDDSKLTYYGSSVKSNKKDNIWLFDPFHSDTTDYDGDATWFTAAEYMPNYQLSARRSNQGYACSMGNYGVTETYNLKVKNITNQDKYFEYVVETSSNVAVFVEDEAGKHSGILKGEKWGVPGEVMASVLIPAGEEKEFSFNLVLPINYVGGIRNSFMVSDEKHTGKTYEEFLSNPKAKTGPSTRGIMAYEVKDKLPDEVKDIIDGDYDCYEFVKSENGYLMRWMAWDGNPYYYTARWDFVKTIYYLDEDYNIVDRYTPEKIARLAMFYDGYYYIEDADSARFRSLDGQEWEEYPHRMPLTDITFDASKPSKWAEKEVKRAYEIDIVSHRIKDTLVYTDNMTRGMFCDVLANMLRLKNMLPEVGEMTFSDTESDNVSRLWNAKIISGYDESTFGPDDAITREQASMLLYNTAKYMGYIEENEKTAPKETSKPTETSETPAPEENPVPDGKEQYRYADDNDIGGWAKKAVYQMNSIGIMSGVGDDKFAPQDKYTNEQSIATIMRLYDAF
ncbi:MAG: S-layer homology domain-containing protein [Oscillospiraceae bacterium]|nr:S-layer homology domain-containing protein [Oscillospiraceae bacterium]